MQTTSTFSVLVMFLLNYQTIDQTLVYECKTGGCVYEIRAGHIGHITNCSHRERLNSTASGKQKHQSQHKKTTLGFMHKHIKPMITKLKL